MRASRRPLLLLFAGLAMAGVLWLVACADDPFDPLLGPRRPLEGAQRYLDTRPDIPDIDKHRLLQREPVAAVWLADLARSPAREIRAYVAMNPATPPPVLVALASDPDVGVRQQVTRHPALPRATAQQLLSDPSLLVRMDALASPAWSAQDLRDLYRQGHRGGDIASNPNAPTDLLLTIARESGTSLPYDGLARSPNISPEIEAILLGSRWAEAASFTLARNPRVSCATLQRLTADRQTSVAAAAVRTLEQRQQAGRGC